MKANFFIISLICFLFAASVFAGRLYYVPNENILQKFEKISNLYINKGYITQKRLDLVMELYLNSRKEKGDYLWKPYDYMIILKAMINHEKNIYRLQFPGKAFFNQAEKVREGPMFISGKIFTKNERVCDKICMDCFFEEGCLHEGGKMIQKDLYYIHITDATDVLIESNNIKSGEDIFFGDLSRMHENYRLEQPLPHQQARLHIPNAESGTVNELKSAANTGKAITLSFLMQGNYGTEQLFIRDSRYKIIVK